MKGVIPEQTGLIQFVSQVMKERHLPENEILEAINKAEEEMLQNGIVAVGDICNNKLSLPQKGKGRMWYHNFIEATGLYLSWLISGLTVPLIFSMLMQKRIRFL
ncbi:MAG: hypothetical protein ACXWV2_12340, partial [Chitinophagaceae bacterium]